MNRPSIIAHRGASANAPENTMAAFRLAYASGAEGLEFDVRLSKDGVPVVIHDATLERVGELRSKVSDLTLEELKQIDVGSWFDRKHKKRQRTDHSGERIPTLDEVLELAKASDGPLYIELKCDQVSDAEATARAVCGLIGDSPALPRMIVKSFRPAAVMAVRSLLPGVTTAALFSPAILMILRRRRHMIDLAREFGADQLSLHYSLAAKHIVRMAAMPVTVWTVDDPKWIAKCERRGIGALITNDPARFAATME